mgnify:CR=1 FL=1
MVCYLRQRLIAVEIRRISRVVIVIGVVEVTLIEYDILKASGARCVVNRRKVHIRIIALIVGIIALCVRIVVLRVLIIVLRIRIIVLRVRIVALCILRVSLIILIICLLIGVKATE